MRYAPPKILCSCLSGGLIVACLWVGAGAAISEGASANYASSDRVNATSELAGTNTPLKVVAFNFKPVTYLENGVAKGIHSEMLRELMAEAGLNFEVVFMPPGRIYSELARSERRVDIWRSARFAKAVNHGLEVTPTIFLPLPLGLFGLAGNKPPKITALTAMPLITIMGYSLGGEADKLQKRVPGMTMLYANGHEAAFRMLKAGRARYVLDYWHPGMMTAKQLGIGNVAYTDVFSRPTVLWVARKHPEAGALVAKLGEASARILARRANAAQASQSHGKETPVEAAGK